VGGAHHRAAVGGHHGVLQAAGHGRQQRAVELLAEEQGDGGQQQRRFQGQGHAVAAAQAQGAVLDDQAAEHRAQTEGDQHRPQVAHRAPVAVGQRRAQLGGGAGEVADGQVLEAEEAHRVDHAGDAGEGDRTHPHPAWQPRVHACAGACRRIRPGP